MTIAACCYCSAPLGVSRIPEREPGLYVMADSVLACPNGCADPNGFAAEISRLASEVMADIARRREELIRAWVAETGLQPSESVLCEQLCEDGVRRTWIERRQKVPR